VKDNRVYLEHNRDALDDIAAYTTGGPAVFFADRMRQDVNLEIVWAVVWRISHTCRSGRPR
jgi:hypothetical protein